MSVRISTFRKCPKTPVCLPRSYDFYLELSHLSLREVLQVIDNFVSCTIAGIERRIKELRISNANKIVNTVRNDVESSLSSCEDSFNTSETIEVMKNVRQFISGVKNYLIKTGEGELHNIMQEERSKVCLIPTNCFVMNVGFILGNRRNNT